VLEAIIAVGLGAASGMLAVLAPRVPWLAWLMLAPLAAAVYLYSPVDAAVAGAVFGVLAWALAAWRMRLPWWVFPAMVTAISAAFAGTVCALAAWAWPRGVPAWGALIMPAAAVVLSGTPRLGGYGGPMARLEDPFPRSQEAWLPIVHVARLAGSDLVIPALLALAASVPVMLLVHLPPSAVTVAAAIASLLVVASALGFGLASYRRAVGRAQKGQSLRVAAVSVDGNASPWIDGGQSRAPVYRDVGSTIRRYQPHVARATAAGARLIVLPEQAIVVTAQSRDRWLAAVSGWAKEANAILVTGLFDADLQQNQLVITDETGAIVATYEKQHPFGMDPKPQTRMPPALLPRDPVPVSGVICFDLDYADLVRPVARAGGVLAVPANDWAEVAEMHHRSAVWTPVMAGVPMVRSAGHGTSAIYDAAGRVLARASTFDGPVALVADVPISKHAAKAKIPSDRPADSAAA
jgi:apolipoprotein N-acyltransferase